MSGRQPESELAELVPRCYKELYRRRLLEGLERLAESIDEAMGVNTGDEIDMKRENLTAAIEASYIAIDASIEAAANYMYRRKLSAKSALVRAPDASL
ncbi:MAG: hypothetical protein M1562_03335 [Candidatus Marsarchaeota archaeon]|jgi:hypothetical protein|nr:hypothetical protein [Candidatus Marsarchaeota archaeon]